MRKVKKDVIQISLIVILSAACVYLWIGKSTAEKKAHDYLFSLNYLSLIYGNVERLEAVILKSTTDELQQVKALTSSQTPALTPEEIEQYKGGPWGFNYPIYLFEATFFYPLENDLKAAISRAKAKEVLSQMSDEDLEAISQGNPVGLENYGIDFSRHRIEVADALVKHFLNNLREVASQQ